MPSPKSDESPDHADGPKSIESLTQEKLLQNVQSTNINSAEDDAIGDGLLAGIGVIEAAKTDSPTRSDRTDSLTFPGQVERRRRKLPEIPKTKRCESHLLQFTAIDSHQTDHSHCSFLNVDVRPDIVGRRVEQFESLDNTAHAIGTQMWLLARRRLESGLGSPAKFGRW